MFTKSFTSLRRFSVHALTMTLFCVSFSNGAEAQAAPVVAPSYAQALTPPSKLGTVFQTAIDSFGDLLFVDYSNGALYEYPAGGGAVITLLPAGSLGSGRNPGLAIGAANDLYLEGNFNNVLGRFPYNPTTKSWDGSIRSVQPMERIRRRSAPQATAHPRRPMALPAAILRTPILFTSSRGRSPSIRTTTLSSRHRTAATSCSRCPSSELASTRRRPRSTA